MGCVLKERERFACIFMEFDDWDFEERRLGFSDYEITTCMHFTITIIIIRIALKYLNVTEAVSYTRVGEFTVQTSTKLTSNAARIVSSRFIIPIQSCDTAQRSSGS